MSELLNIPLGQIRASERALRKVDRKSEGYLDMKASVQEHGILNPIVVRPVEDPESGESGYEVIEGLHRFTCCLDLGAESIPANVLNLNDMQVLEAQIVGNLQRIETKPVEYSNQLKRMMELNPNLTTSDIAHKISRSITYVSERLNLTKLDERIAELVDNGEIKIANAFALAKLPLEEQNNFVQDAVTKDSSEFQAVVRERVNEIKKAQREGKAAQPATYTPVAKARKLAQIKEEYETGTLADQLCSDCSSPVDGFRRGLEYAMSLDPVTQAAEKERWEAKQREKEEAKQRRADAAAKKKAERLAKKAEEAQAAVEA